VSSQLQLIIIIIIIIIIICVNGKVTGRFAGVEEE
jgi:ABC-type cobalt transport system substrate-binding protein